MDGPVHVFIFRCNSADNAEHSSFFLCSFCLRPSRPKLKTLDSEEFWDGHQGNETTCIKKEANKQNPVDSECEWKSVDGSDCVCVCVCVCV